MQLLRNPILKLAVLSVVLSIWAALGRVLFGIGGWLLFVTLFLLGPALLITLSVLTILTARRPDVRASRQLQPYETKLWWLLTAVVFVGQFFLVDPADDDASIQSVFTKYTTHKLNGLSMLLVAGLAVAAVVILSRLYVYTFGRLHQPATTTQNTLPTTKDLQN